MSASVFPINNRELRRSNREQSPQFVFMRDFLTAFRSGAPFVK
jgi:hypothetical protein